MSSATETQRHDAKWTPAVLDQIADIASRHDWTGLAFDPFAGIGHGVQRDLGGRGFLILGLDLEEKFADAEDWVTQGDALDERCYPLDMRLQQIFTSPTYGNRMAGSYIGPECSECDGLGQVCDHCDGSGRNSDGRYGYAQSLNAPPTEGSSALLNWGPKYRLFHARWLVLIADMLPPGECRLVLNMKDHYRGNERQYVCQWWIQAATNAGFCLSECHSVPVGSLQHGQNGQDRVGFEMVMVFDLMGHD